MRISEQWLREWVSTASTKEQITHKLTMAGLEMNPPEPVASGLEKILVGKVLKITRHPDADKLKLCQVSVGDNAPLLSIVCGAANVSEGMLVPVALNGAKIASGQKIKKGKIRGEVSEGMLCSASELGLEEESAGLLALADDAELGLDIKKQLGLDDFIFEFDLTPNRGDCLSVLGIARELAAIEAIPFFPPSIKPVLAQQGDSINLALPEPERCSRYTGRIIKEINSQAVTPLWMKERLRRSGLRSLGPLVDVTNYVMLELGQPLHAFDLDKLQGEIQVRSATPQENLKLLNGQEVTLNSDYLVIADQTCAIALAGIMGGEFSSVTEKTRSILLESAWFAPRTIAGRARRLGIPTDASHRFERGVDPQIQALAIERATALILEICGGVPGPTLDKIDASHPHKNKEIDFTPARVNQYLGTDLSDESIRDIFISLGLKIEKFRADQWKIVPPGYRFDLEIEEDLIEEVARIHGYEKIIPSLPQKSGGMLPQLDARVSLNNLKNVLTGRGYNEVISYSFVDPELQALIDPDQVPLPLDNPLSKTMSVMRTSLWPGLLEIVRYNQRRQQATIRIFESGSKFLQNTNKLLQDTVISGIVVGEAAQNQWDGDGRLVDFFDLKADVELLTKAGIHEQEFLYRAATHPALHPGQSARLFKGNAPVGWLGCLHPEIARKLDIEGSVQLFEIDLPALSQGVIPQYVEASRFPSIRRDLALLVDKAVAVEELIQCCKKSANKLLQDIWLFDQYQGTGIATNERSLGLALILQAKDRTLTDVEAAQIMNKVIADLASQVGARLRDS